jgi:hypothetical protein
MIVPLFLLSLVTNILVGYYASHRNGSGRGGQIYDVGFHLLPNWEKFEHLPDYLLTVPILFLFYKWPSWSGKTKNNYLLLLTLMYFARALCNAVTVLPYTKQEPCKLKPRFAFCNDYTFSGHTTFNVVTSNFVGAPLWPVWPLISSTVSVLTRDHYTLDILLPWILFFALKCNVIR